LLDPRQSGAAFTDTKSVVVDCHGSTRLNGRTSTWA
jgi:hypothetical protein